MLDPVCCLPLMITFSVVIKYFFSLSKGPGSKLTSTDFVRPEGLQPPIFWPWGSSSLEVPQYPCMQNSDAT